MHHYIDKIPSPCFVIEERTLRRNLELIHKVQQEAGVEIILAFKGFAMWSVFDIVSEYITGAAASSLNEARLSFEEMKVKAHTYCVGINPQEIDDLLNYSSHLTFNSLGEFNKYKDKAITKGISCGIRINPGFSTVKTELYNPASPYSRLGLTSGSSLIHLPEGIEGIHFHSLCENDSFALEKTLVIAEEKFGHLIKQAKWINMGGGHLMTKEGYDTKHLISLLKSFKKKYDIHIILEPGSAFAWQTGYLLSTILDIVENNDVKTAILDVSFTCHMPDCLEMPYKPEITGATDPISGKPTYRLGGNSCLAGDFMTAYSFDNKLKVGDKVIFEDMIHYTMVKTTMFNGVKHPSIGIWTKDDSFKLIREFNYEDYKNRLS